MFTIFMGGISPDVSQALLSPFFEIDMSWGATAKEMEGVNSRPGDLANPAPLQVHLRLLLRECTGLMVAGFYAFPFGWRIEAFSSIFPLAMTVSCQVRFFAGVVEPGAYDVYLVRRRGKLGRNWDWGSGISFFNGSEAHDI